MSKKLITIGILAVLAAVGFAYICTQVIGFVLTHSSIGTPTDTKIVD
jgi:hypothetical protein